LPTISFKGTQDWYDQNLYGAKNSNWMISLNTSLNIFDSGLTQAQVKQAQYGTDTAMKQARQAMDSVALEVRQAYQSMREAEKRIDTNKLAVEQATEDYKIAEYAFHVGVNTNQDVINAELALTQAKTNYIQALYDYNTSKAQLDKAIGVPVR
jgi:outer membrane protein TolC